MWNEWAKPLQSERDRLYKAGLFQLESEQATDFIAPRKAATNEDTEAFQKKALVNFSGYRFSEISDFRGFIFPGEVRFGGDQPMLNRGSKPAIFEEYTSFDDAVVLGDFRFLRVECHANIGFRRFICKGAATFAEAKFHKAVWFRDSIFHDDVWFGQAAFESYCDFHNTTFAGVVAFRGITSSGIFDLYGTEFRKAVPDFSQASFKESPGFDNVSYPARGFWTTGFPQDIAKYRSIRRLSIQGHDHEGEAISFKGEIRSKRGTEHKPWHATFWFAVLYDAVSDFGRSMMRPFWIWLTSIPFFALAYLSHANKLPKAFVACADGTSVWLKSLLFSLKNAVLFVQWDREQIQ